MKTSKQALRRRMAAIDARMEAASFARGGDAPCMVAVWGRAQDAVCAAESALAADDLRAAAAALDDASAAMREHAAMLRSARAFLARGEEASR